MTHRILFANLVVAAVISPGSSAVAQESSISGQWKGTLNAMDIELRLGFKFRPQPDGSVRGTLTIFDQSPDEIPLTSVVLDSSHVTVRSDLMGIEFIGTLSADGEAIEGNWRQATMSFPLRIELEKRAIDLAVAEKREPAPAAVREWLRRRAIPLKTAEAGNGFEDLEPLKAAVGEARIVALGEATHGTREFFQLKHRMFEFLVEEMGFRIFAIEANWTEALRVNDYLLRGEGDPSQTLAGLYFWVWNTKEVLALIEWMRSYNLGSSGFLVGRCELGCRIPFPSPSYDSRSVLAVKGSLRRAKRAPLTAPGRSEAHNLYEGKGIRGTSHLSTISASAPQSAFHRSTVLKCGRLLARSWPVPPTRNPEEPQS